MRRGLTIGPYFGVSAYDPVMERLSQDYARLLNQLGPEAEEVQALERQLDEYEGRRTETAPPSAELWEVLQEFVDYRFERLPEDDKKLWLADLWRGVRDN